MRFIKPIGADSDNSASETCPDPSPTLPSSQLAALEYLKPRRLCRFRPDSWLSIEDANFLLERRAGWEAKNKNYAVAIQLLTKLVTSEPDNADHHANRGLMYSQLESWDRALTDYNRALELNPELDSAYNNRANLYAKQHNWLEALSDYDQAIDLNPLNIRARLNQAITFREMGHYEDALACLDIALFFKAESAFLYAERGRVYHLQGDWNCAIADYNTALTLTDRPEQDHPSKPLGDLNRLNQQVKAWMRCLS